MVSLSSKNLCTASTFRLSSKPPSLSRISIQGFKELNLATMQPLRPDATKVAPLTGLPDFHFICPSIVLSIRRIITSIVCNITIAPLVVQLKFRYHTKDTGKDIRLLGSPCVKQMARYD